MSRPNVRLVASIYEAAKRQDIQAVTAVLHPEMTVTQSSEVPWGGKYTAPGALLQLFGKVSQSIESEFITEHLIDAGEHVAWVGLAAGKVNGSGEPFSAPEIHLWELRDGKVASLQVFLDHPIMLKVLGKPMADDAG